MHTAAVADKGNQFNLNNSKISVHILFKKVYGPIFLK